MIPIWTDTLPDTPIGPLCLGATERGLAFIDFESSLESFAARLASRGYATRRDQPGRLKEALDQVAGYLRGVRREFDLALDWRTMLPFQEAVLRATLAIPYGQVSTYAAIARQVGRPRAARAVGRAEATNPIPLVIPCHRVLGSDGKLHGYGAPSGVQVKAWLLALEGRP
ncbi:MAG: methylated-DNA--[protein]-cysteine S-methyltransferase [Anaerolineales bacterium]|nr:methylated-DNA--[protein]-cysteine S-methyltransferase [Anaerolineales bacterium]